MRVRLAQRIARVLQGDLLTVALLAAALAALSPAAPALAQCAANATDQTCTNPAGTTISPDGILDNNNANVTNYGTILNTNGFDGINANNNLTVSNFGLIVGSTGLSTNFGNIDVFNAQTITGNQVGIFAAAQANVTNLGTITGDTIAVLGNVINLTNSGTITSNQFTVFGTTVANVTNSGTISGDPNGLTNSGVGVRSNGDVNVANSGTIAGSLYGVFATNNTTVTNSGTIQGGDAGVTGINTTTVVNSGVISASGFLSAAVVSTKVTVANSGTIRGWEGVVGVGGGSTLINSGTIIGFGGTAVDFSGTAGNSLTFLPGSRIVGEVLLGTGDNVTFVTGRDVAKLFTFGCICGGGLTDTGSLVNVTGGAPYVISGDRVAILDPTAFNMIGRSLMDFTGNVSSLIGGRTDEAASAGTAATAFAAVAPPSAASRVFDDFPAQAYSAERSMALLPGTRQSDLASGITFWSSGFAAGRRQHADGPMLSASSMAYGGAVGADRRVAGDLLVGGFVGAGQGRVNVAMDSQKIDTDYVFGGVYGRYERGTHFTDFTFSGGHSHNASARQVANNLAPSGLDTATAGYGGWFVSPEIAYGVRMPFGNGDVLTPSARVRYLAGFLDGYSEAGSMQNLSVGSRLIQNVEERFELALSRVSPLRQGFLKTTATFGALSVQRLGDTVNANLIGQDLSFATPGDSITAGLYAGFGVDYRVTRRVGLFAAAEGTLMSDDSLAGIARAGVRAAF